MFCSRCGKTLPGEGKRCKHCGMDVGEAAFSSTSYTSSPPVSWDGQGAWEVAYDEDVPAQPTGYAYVDQPLAQPDVFGQTLSQISAFEPRSEMQPISLNSSDLAEDNAESLAQEDETAMDADAAQKQVVKRASGEGAQPEIGFELPKVTSQGVSEELKRKIAEHGTPTAARVEDVLPPDTVSKRLHKVLIALVSLVLVLVASFFLLRLYSAPKPTIEGVTQSLYTEGKALIASHVTAEYRQAMLGDFQADYSNAQKKYAEAPAQFPAMLAKVEKPLANDQLFIDTLVGIQNEISLASGQDFVYMSQKDDSSGMITPEAVAAAEKRANDAWDRVAEHFKMLETAAAAADLENIKTKASAPMATPEVAASPTPKPAYTKLSKGKRGETVKKLQNRLYELGYFKGVRDGIYGPATETAVKEFQEHVDMNPDGVARVAMQELLYSDRAPKKGEPKITATPKPEATPAGDALPANAQAGEVTPDGGALSSDTPPPAASETPAAA